MPLYLGKKQFGNKSFLNRAISTAGNKIYKSVYNPF